MGKKITDTVNVNIKLEMRYVPYKKRKIATELEKFCAECDERLAKLSDVIGSGVSDLSNAGCWSEGDRIDEQRKIFIKRTGKYRFRMLQ